MHVTARGSPQHSFWGFWGTPFLRDAMRTPILTDWGIIEECDIFIRGQELYGETSCNALSNKREELAETD